MGKGLWERPWVRHVAVAVGYGVTYLAFREISLAQWEITAGLRLAVLLLVPYRYWAALIVGESAYYITVGYVCSSVWGVEWGLGCAIPGIAYAAPVIYWVRKRWPPVLRNATYINMGRLLTCALLASVAVTLRNLSLFFVIKNLPADYVVNYYKLASDYFIGNYLGILTVMPLALLGYQKVIGKNWPELQNGIENSRLLFESVCLGLPVLALLLWIGINAPPHAPARQMAQVAMFLPVVWLAFRHGWQGAATGGAAASCAVMWLMPQLWDPMTIQAEAIVAFAISTMLIMGARIGSLDKHVEQERIDVRTALALAQRNVYLGEMQLRMTSQALEQIKESVQAGFAMMMGRLRHLQPAVDDRGYQRYALVAQDQLHCLADSLYPVALRERGLPSALREGGLPQVLRDSGLTYSCDLRGPVSKLSHALRMTIYRIIWEAAADACMKRNVSDIRIHVRVAERRGRIGVLIVARFRMYPAQLAFVDWDELVPRIVRGTSGLGLRAVRDRAAIFEGRTRIQSIASGHQLSILLVDPIVPGVAISPAGQWTEC
ncbi:MASE1 domain-containing protein [Dyella humi]|uniref:MASE1 domain-containing protein n=1 Tax=Dyella humi TaxID=1770547 RepID=A0ABW8IHL3_9GAMM